MKATPQLLEESPRGQPRGLYPLIAVKTCDSFGFLGLRALLIIYLVQIMRLGDARAFDVVGAYPALSFMFANYGAVFLRLTAAASVAASLLESASALTRT